MYVTVAHCANHHKQSFIQWRKTKHNGIYMCNIHMMTSIKEKKHGGWPVSWDILQHKRSCCNHCSLAEHNISKNCCPNIKYSLLYLRMSVFCIFTCCSNCDTLSKTLPLPMFPTSLRQVHSIQSTQQYRASIKIVDISPTSEDLKQL